MGAGRSDPAQDPGGQPAGLVQVPLTLALSRKRERGLGFPWSRNLDPRAGLRLHSAEHWRSPCRRLAIAAALDVCGFCSPWRRCPPPREVRVYATNSAGDNVHVIDPATNKVVQVIEGIETPHGVDFAPDGTRVYISNEADSTLDVVDRKTGRIVKKVPLSGHPNNIAVTKDGSRVVICIAEDKGGL